MNRVNFRRKAMQEGKVMTRLMFQLLTGVMRVNKFIKEQVRQRVVHDPRWNADGCRECDDNVERATKMVNAEVRSW